jgi:hypothetical protein
MTKTEKTLAWLAGGAAALIGLGVFWPKIASAAGGASTPPPSNIVTYIPTYSSPVQNLKVGNALVLRLPDLSSTLYEWRVEGGESITKATVSPDFTLKNPGDITLTFAKPGTATLWVKKVLSSNKNALVEPPMALNVSVS